MTDLDRSTFDRACRRLYGAYRLKLKAEEQEELTQTYFRVLEGFPLDVVLNAGKVLLQQHKRMPSASEWFAACATSKGDTVVGPDNVRRMTVDEQQQWWYAERNRYRDDPCSCFLCQQAGVTDKPLRFVPTELDAEAFETAFNPRREQVQIVGHWAHGDELARWYDTRGKFFAITLRRMPRLLALMREPGQEG